MRNPVFLCQKHRSLFSTFVKLQLIKATFCFVRNPTLLSVTTKKKQSFEFWKNFWGHFSIKLTSRSFIYQQTDAHNTLSVFVDILKGCLKRFTFFMQKLISNFNKADNFWKPSFLKIGKKLDKTDYKKQKNWVNRLFERLRKFFTTHFFRSL